jgi:hypothetical protein
LPAIARRTFCARLALAERAHHAGAARGTVGLRRHRVVARGRAAVARDSTDMTGVGERTDVAGEARARASGAATRPATDSRHHAGSAACSRDPAASGRAARRPPAASGRAARGPPTGAHQARRVAEAVAATGEPGRTRIARRARKVLRVDGTTARGTQENGQQREPTASSAVALRDETDPRSPGHRLALIGRSTRCQGTDPTDGQVRRNSRRRRTASG